MFIHQGELLNGGRYLAGVTLEPTYLDGDVGFRAPIAEETPIADAERPYASRIDLSSAPVISPPIRIGKPPGSSTPHRANRLYAELATEAP